MHPHGSLKKELRGSACFMLPPPVDRDLCDSSQIANFQVMLPLITGTRTTSGVALLLEVSTPLVPEAREEDLRQSRILASRRRASEQLAVGARAQGRNLFHQLAIPAPGQYWQCYCS
ncbi:hypothetical protein FALBO_3693 [Fusarium albosuccineum]|uniref:Uncharacterized protein n=1 Tax=Fusarium albosuccineum TaxID=1237068 RepID=A0A8H4LL27_9HYPO|nr:hypothetical protein FALBO_3693 [Fusarium albosuccineum]